MHLKIETRGAHLEQGTAYKSHEKKDEVERMKSVSATQFALFLAHPHHAKPCAGCWRGRGNKTPSARALAVVTLGEDPKQALTRAGPGVSRGSAPVAGHTSEGTPVPWEDQESFR